MSMYLCTACGEERNTDNDGCFEVGKAGLICEDCHAEREEAERFEPDPLIGLDRVEAGRILQALGNAVCWLNLSDPDPGMRVQVGLALAGAKHTVERAVERNTSWSKK